MRHGEVSGVVDEETFLGLDPALALVTADMHAWLEAHPCTCDDDAGVCECLDPIVSE